MKIEYDEHKNVANITKHGMPLSNATLMDVDNAYIRQDSRDGYGESRYIAYGEIKHRLHVMVFTLRDNKVRVISVRKANKREMKKYGKAIY